VMPSSGAWLLLIQERTGSSEHRLVARRLGSLCKRGGSTRWLAGRTERMYDSFWRQPLRRMDGKARQLVQQAGWHESQYRTLYL
ncbi:type II secretion system F family protein, partial [Pseudomonas aeruginosa]